MRRRVFVKATVVATKLACRQLTRRRASIRTLFELTLRGSVHDEVRPFGPVLLSVDRSLLPRRPSLATQSPDPRHRMSRARYQRSEEHTSELQSRQYLVCRLLLEKK